MTPTQLQLFRQSLLLQLEAAYPGALPASTLLQGLAFAGQEQPPAILYRELAYLTERSLISTDDASLTPGLPRYRLTAAGRDFLASAHLL